MVGRAGRRTVIYRDVTYYVLYFRVSRPGPKVHTLGGHEKLCISVCTLVQCLACRAKKVTAKPFALEIKVSTLHLRLCKCPHAQCVTHGHSTSFPDFSFSPQISDRSSCRPTPGRPLCQRSEVVGRYLQVNNVLGGHYSPVNSVRPRV